MASVYRKMRAPARLHGHRGRARAPRGRGCAQRLPRRGGWPACWRCRARRSAAAAAAAGLLGCGGCCGRTWTAGAREARALLLAQLCMQHSPFPFSRSGLLEGSKWIEASCSCRHSLMLALQEDSPGIHVCREKGRFSWPKQCSRWACTVWMVRCRAAVRFWHAYACQGAQRDAHP